MPIKGINFEKCINCKQCVRECPGLVFEINEVEDCVVYNRAKMCINCGHCISVCPEDAIIYKNMKDEPLIFKGVRDPSTIISYDQINQFIRAKRSIRQYKKKKIPKEIMEKVINSMRYAPTGGNLRQLKCIILSDDEKIKTLSQLIQDEMTSLIGTYNNILNEKKALDIDPIFHNAPHVIILYSNVSLDNVNADIAMTHAMICAPTLGLGTCWIGFAQFLSRNNEIRKNFLGIQGKILAAMTIGYPAVNYERTAPRPPFKAIGLDELE